MGAEVAYSRRKTREFVVQVLYAADGGKDTPLDMLDLMENHFEGDTENDLQLSNISKEYAADLVRAVAGDKEIIDKLISKLSHNWKLHRITRVDRNILRLAVAEFIHYPDIPGKVILNEAIEIARKFGADNSPAFINGILDRINAIEPRPSSPQELKNILVKLDETKPTR